MLLFNCLSKLSSFRDVADCLGLSTDSVSIDLLGKQTGQGGLRK
ncbi:MAG: hypothetical protein ACW981_17625 [Candidatus Hodarchaeales archaeon]